MAVYLGSTKIKEFYLGASKIKQAYLGASPLFVSAQPVTYYVDTGTSYVENVEPGQTVLSPQSFTPTKSGYTFVGWREDTVASGTVISSKVMEDAPITLYAVFSQTFTLTTYNGSNTASTTNGNQYYNNGNAVNPTFTLTQSALSGWNNAGWTTDAAGYSATVADGGTVTLSANATYYSLYTASVTVTKYTNGAGATATETKTRYANVHSTTTFSNPSFTLTEPDLSGWTKYGWADAADFTADVANGGSVTLSANKTYYALYYVNVTVTYYNNSSTAGTSTKARYVRAGGSWTFSNPTFNLTVTAVSGWTVRGWSTSSAANGAISYNSATNFTRDSNVTLYASWSKTVTVSYNGNSNTGGSTSASTGTAYRGYKGDVTNASIALRANGFSRTNYTFYRWALNSASGTQYKAGAAISLNANATMYANWLQTTVNFGYTGKVQTFAAKAGVTYQLKVWGAQGKSIDWISGGGGGYAIGNKAVTANATWYVVVGGQAGYNGGGEGCKKSGFPYSGNDVHTTDLSGGGATHIGLSNAVLKSTAKANLLIVAGGGGAASANSNTQDWERYVSGGAGGGTSGSSGNRNGDQSGYSCSSAGGGTQTSGGAHAVVGYGNANGSYGSYGQGGQSNSVYTYGGYSGGGGGGLYGGGCGMVDASGTGSGGGGSGYTGGVTSGSMSNGQRSGNGYATIVISSVS